MLIFSIKINQDIKLGIQNLYCIWSGNYPFLVEIFKVNSLKKKERKTENKTKKEQQNKNNNFFFNS